MNKKLSDKLMQACNKIECEAYGCDICPLKSSNECLQYNWEEDVLNTVSASRIEDFLEVADNIDYFVGEYKEQKEEQEARENAEYNEWIAELNAGYFRDRALR